MDNRIPTPLTIHLDWVPTDGPQEEQSITANSAAYPDLMGEAIGVSAAIEDLIQQIEHALPDRSYEEALIRCDLAYVPKHIADWNRLMWDSGTWHYATSGAMHDRSTLHEWAATGIPYETADKFRALRLEPADAQRIHDAGHTPEETLPYVHDAEPGGWSVKPDYNIVEWVLARIPADRVRLYEQSASVDEATRWESLVTEYAISDVDLKYAFRVGLSPDWVADNPR